MAGIPLGIQIVNPLCGNGKYRNILCRGYILLFTFFVYTTYHLARRPISVAKNVLHKNCTLKPNCSSWAPFGNGSNFLFGDLDSAFLFSYAFGVFISGQIAERMDLRIFLSVGMLGTCVFTALFGFGRYWQVHSFAFFVVCQILAGLLQSTGWPAVVACVANWFGKGKRGFVMGVWNSHTSVGNILGAVIAAAFVDYNWGLSFIVPAMLIGGMGILVFFFLVPRPELVGCSPPDHRGTGTSVNKQYGEEKSPLIEQENGEGEEHTSVAVIKEAPPISFVGALKIPGVLEFSFCLFFAKLVSYTFLFWLPKYIYSLETDVPVDEKAKEAADLSTLFDVGGIIGGILAGLVSDLTGGRATTCLIMLLLGAPMLYIYQAFAHMGHAVNIATLMVLGFLVNGPYALITTAVSADLGTHECLQGNSKALSTVTAIIDGTGSIGAALGPLLTGIIYGATSNWKFVFFMLIGADFVASILLARLVYKEVLGWYRQRMGTAQVNVVQCKDE